MITKPLLRQVVLLAVSLFAGLFLVVGAAAQPAGFTPISIYPLDNGQAVDQLGHSAAGQVNGAVPTVDRHGNANGALLFDGVNDFVQTSEDSNFKPLTFSVWFRADNISGEHSIVDSDRSGGYGHSLIIGYDDPSKNDDTPRDGSLDVQYHNGFWDTGKKIETGRWYHAFVTYGDEMRLYLDGDLVAQQPYSGSSFDGSTFRFGRHNDGDPQWFKGAIDDVRFYNKELPAEVVEEITETEGGGQAVVTSPSPTPPATPIVNNSHGDVHISTPDGLVYDFQAAGEFYLARSGGPEAIVQARQEMLKENPSVSVNIAAAMMVGGDKLEFYGKPERAFYLNDTKMALPSSDLTLPGGGSIISSGTAAQPDFTIMWPDGSFGARVIIFANSHLDLGVAKLKNNGVSYGGILGNLDGNAQNDMKVRDGDVLTPPANINDLNRFGDSWRVPAGESLFRGATTAPVRPERQLTVMDLDAGKRDEAKQTCEQAGITDKLALGNCTYDVAQTGNEAFVESAKVFEEATEAAPPQTKVAGDAAGKAALTNSIFPIAERFELEQGAKYFSESGLHYLVFQDDGNLVVYTAAGRYVWGIQNSGKDYQRNKRAVMQEDGNLVTYDGQEPIWATDTYGNAGAALTLTPAGELQIVRGGRTLWSSSNTQ